LPFYFLLAMTGIQRMPLNYMNKTDITGSNLLADKAYGTKEILAYIIEHEATVVIPLKSNAKETWSVDYWIYKERHLVE